MFFELFGSQNSRFLDFQISRFLDLGTRFLAMAGCNSRGHHSPDLGGFWTALPDHRIQEIQGTRQYRENPISASPVWGTIEFVLLQPRLKR